MFAVIVLFCIASVVATLIYLALRRWLERLVVEQYGLKSWDLSEKLGNECAGYRKTPTPIPRDQCWT